MISLKDDLIETARIKAIEFIGPMDHTEEEKRILTLAFMCGYSMAKTENGQGSKTEKNGENGRS